MIEAGANVVITKPLQTKPLSYVLSTCSVVYESRLESEYGSSGGGDENVTRTISNTTELNRVSWVTASNTSELNRVSYATVDANNDDMSPKMSSSLATKADEKTGVASLTTKLR